MRRSPTQTQVSSSEISLSRNATGREFQRHGPATKKLLSPRRVCVLFVAHVNTSADRSDRRPTLWKLSQQYLEVSKVFLSYLVPVFMYELLIITNIATETRALGERRPPPRRFRMNSKI